MNDEFKSPRLPTLPYERELEPHDPNVEILPKVFLSTNAELHSENFRGDNLV
jgi:hypothetical protein